MGNFSSHTESIINALKSDNVTKLSHILTPLNLPLNAEITQGRTGIVLCALYGSSQCLTYFIDKGNDINIPDKTDNSTPLILASKFNFIPIIDILLSHNCDTHFKNAYGLTALDMAIIRGNYDTCLYLMDKAELTITKTLENYQAWNHDLQFPLFNLELFYTCLMNKVPSDKVPSFANVGGSRRKQFEGKVPDPNESWGDFVKRLGRLELYQPPLVDADQVDKKDSLYMKMQSRLCEMEYGVKIDLKGRKEGDVERSVNKRNEEIKQLNQGNNYMNDNDISEQKDIRNHTMRERDINETEAQLSDEHHISAKTQVLKVDQSHVLILKDSSRSDV